MHGKIVRGKICRSLVVHKGKKEGEETLTAALLSGVWRKLEVLVHSVRKGAEE